MKLTLANVKKIRKETNNLLTKKVCGYVVEHWSSYSDKKHIFTDVLYYGCQSGIVSNLLYHKDTLAFYQRFKQEINSLLYDVMASTGLYSPSSLFGDKWDNEDPLVIETQNQNLLAWFGFEETLRNIGSNFHELENYI